MDLNVAGKKLNTAKIKNLLTQDEKGIDTVNIILPKMYNGIDLSAFSFKMRGASEKNTLTEQVLIKSIHVENLNLLWTITSDFTAISGVLSLEIVGVDTSNTEIIKITADDIFVKSGVLGTYNPPTDVLENALAQMQTAVATCQALADGMATIENSLTSKSTVNGVSVAQAALINDAVQTKASYDNTQTTLDGTSIHSTIADDALIEIIKIGGATSQFVTAQGKNLFKGVFTSGLFITVATNTIDVNALTQCAVIPCAAGQQYTVSKQAAGTRFKVGFTTVFPVAGAAITGLADSDLSLSIAATAPVGTKYLIAYVYKSDTDTVMPAIQIELGTIATTYEPFVPNSPSPDYPAVITNASNFDIIASNSDSTLTNKINISYEMPKLPNGVQNTIEQETDGKWKFIKRIGKVILTATGTIADAKTNGQYICTIAPTGTLTGMTFTMPIGGTSATIYYELATPVETIIPDLYLTSYKGTTNYSTTSNPQVNSVINVKSKLWSNDYKENAEEQLFRFNIGGTNLNQNTAWLTDTAGYAFTASGWARDTTTKMGNCISAKVSRTGLVTTTSVYITGSLPTNIIACKLGDVFTVSVYFMTADYTAVDDTMRLGFDQLDASNLYVRSTDIKTYLTENNVWRKYTHTVTITDAAIKSIRSLVGIYRNGTVWAAGLKVEKGYIATDWSPNPQDLRDASCQLLLGTFATRPTTVAQKSMYLATDKAVGDVNRLTISTDGVTWYQI